MLLGQHPRGQAVGCVAFEHRHHRLRQDRTVVQLRRDPMHRGAGQGVVIEHLLHQVLDALAAGAAGVIPGLDIIDTIKQVADAPGGLPQVRGTLPREELVAVQTPQGFALSVLREAHARAAAEGWEVTDDAALLERCGHGVTVVPGEADNLKITTPADLLLAEALMAQAS